MSENERKRQMPDQKDISDWDDADFSYMLSQNYKTSRSCLLPAIQYCGTEIGNEIGDTLIITALIYIRSYKTDLINDNIYLEAKKAIVDIFYSILDQVTFQVVKNEISGAVIPEFCMRQSNARDTVLLYLIEKGSSGFDLNEILDDCTSTWIDGYRRESFSMHIVDFTARSTGFMYSGFDDLNIVYQNSFAQSISRFSEEAYANVKDTLLTEAPEEYIHTIQQWWHNTSLT